MMTLRDTRGELVRDPHKQPEQVRNRCAEAEDAAQSEELARLRQEVEQLRAERDAAARLLEASAPTNELLTGLKQLQKEVASLRAQQTGARSRRRLRRARPAPDEKEPPRPTPWYLHYADAFGQQHTLGASAENIRQWFREGRLDASVRISQAPRGPFEPLGRFEEFRDLTVALERRPASPSPARPTAAPRTQKAGTEPVAPSRIARRDLASPPDHEDAAEMVAAIRAARSPARAAVSRDWVAWAIPLLLALLAALILGQILFR